MVQSIFGDQDDEEAETPLLTLPPETLPAPPPAPGSFLSLTDEYDTPLKPRAPATQLDGTQRYNVHAELPRSTFAESPAENIRRSGLAWSAGIVFLGAVVFMLFLGWGADLILGTSPWGLVVGIVLGSTIGFVQFFRISSQIFASHAEDAANRSQMSEERDRDARL